MPHPNEQFIRRYVASWDSGDIEVVKGFFADDVVLHFAGDGPLSGTWRGKQQFFGERVQKRIDLGIAARVDEVVNVLATDDHAVLQMLERFERPDREPLHVNRLAMYRIENEQIVEVWAHDADQPATDDYFN